MEDLVALQELADEVRRKVDNDPEKIRQIVSLLDEVTANRGDSAT